MRDFSGIVDLPAMFMVLGALGVIVIASGFSRARSILTAHAMLIEVAFLYLLISWLPLFEDALNFMSLPYIASFALVTLVIAGLVSILLGVFVSAVDLATPQTPPAVAFRIAAIGIAIVGLGYIASGNTNLSAYFRTSAVIFTLVLVALVGLISRLSSPSNMLQNIADQLPSIAILGLVISISAAVLDVYELPALLPMLGFGVNVVLLAVLLQTLLNLGGWVTSRLDRFRFVVLGLCLVASTSLVLLSDAATY